MTDKFSSGRKAAEQFATACNSIKTNAEAAGRGAAKGATGLSKFGSSIVRIAKYRAIRAVIRNIMEAFSEGLQNVRDYSNGLTGEGHRIAEAFNNLSAHSLTMKNQIGSAFAELLTAIMPIVEKIVAMLTRAANVISQFFAALGGNSRYYKAVDATAQVSKNLGGGAKSAKEIRNQLMGFDVINRLDKPNDSSGGGGGGSANKANTMFEYTDIEKKIKDSLAAIELALGASMLGLGAILLFSGASPLIGLGLMAAGAVLLAKSVKEDWSSVPTKIQSAVLGVVAVVSMSLLAIGAILAFSGANIPLGIGLMLAGGIYAATVALAWGKVTGEVQNQIAAIMGIIGAGLIVFGVILLFAGMVPIGLGLLLAGGVGAGMAVALNWDGLKNKLKETWDGIKNWWTTNVKKYFTREYWQAKIDDMFNIKPPHVPMPHFEVSWEPVGQLGSLFGLNAIPHISLQFYATGGFPEDGLFMANHSELVGQFANGKTAVANNEQIIQGIERGVYNAMTSALSNQQSGDRDIRVYLDGKEIGAASRRYERSISRATGVSMA